MLMQALRDETQTALFQYGVAPLSVHKPEPTGCQHELGSELADQLLQDSDCGRMKQPAPQVFGRVWGEYVVAVKIQKDYWFQDTLLGVPT